VVHQRASFRVWKKVFCLVSSGNVRLCFYLRKRDDIIEDDTISSVGFRFYLEKSMTFAKAPLTFAAFCIGLAASAYQHASRRACIDQQLPPTATTAASGKETTKTSLLRCTSHKPKSLS
jgi:hypothetical protein